MLQNLAERGQLKSYSAKLQIDVSFCSDPCTNVCISMPQILPGHRRFYMCISEFPCFDFYLFFVQNILAPNLKPFPIGNRTAHIWVSSSAALPRAQLVDRGFGELLMPRFVIIIVSLKLRLEASRPTLQNFKLACWIEL